MQLICQARATWPDSLNMSMLLDAKLFLPMLNQDVAEEDQDHKVGCPQRMNLGLNVKLNCHLQKEPPSAIPFFKF